MRRRVFLLGTAASVVVATASRMARASGRRENFEVTKSQAEWRALLSEEQYLVLREEETEAAFTSPLLNEERAGTYHCAGCELPLFASQAKYDSGTGWPSFHAPLPDAIGTREDRTLVFLTRTEVHCRRCGGHLGHVFDDGPPPTGKRYCINGLALRFEPA